jgi:virginiamycin B lyase
MLKRKEHRVRPYRVLAFTLMGLYVLTSCMPRPGFISEASLPSGHAPRWIVVGPDGALWFTEDTFNAIGRITTDTKTVTEYCIPTGIPLSTQPCTESPLFTAQSITAGPPGTSSVWFTTETLVGRIMTNGTHHISFYCPVCPSGQPTGGIVTGPDGNIWYSMAEGLGSLTPAGGFATNGYGCPGPCLPTAVIAGPDHNLWFIASSNGPTYIGATASNYLIGNDVTDTVLYCIPTGIRVDSTYQPPCQATTDHAPYQMTIGPDGNLWFTESAANRIGRIMLTTSLPGAPPQTVSVSEYCLTPSTQPPPENTTNDPFGITAGPDGNVWFTEQIGHRIGRINPQNGEIRTFDIPTPDGEPLSEPLGIVTGPDGRLWFTGSGNAIWSISTMTESSVVGGMPCSS